MVLNLSIVRLVATGIVLLVFVGAAVISLGSIDSPTYWFPVMIAIAGAMASAYSFGHDLRRVLKGESLVDGEVTDLGASVADSESEDADQSGPTVRRRVLIWTLMFIALPALSLVIPFFFASLMWLAATLRFIGRRSWVFVAISVAVFAVVLNLLIVFLQIRVPPALLTGWG